MIKHVVMAGVLSAVLAAGVRAEVTTGAAAPDFTLTDSSGTSHESPQG